MRAKTAVSPYTRILGRLILVIAEWGNSPDSTNDRNRSLEETRACTGAESPVGTE